MCYYGTVRGKVSAPSSLCHLVVCFQIPIKADLKVFFNLGPQIGTAYSSYQEMLWKVKVPVTTPITCPLFSINLGHHVPNNAQDTEEGSLFHL